MSKFKAGDVVERNQFGEFRGLPSGRVGVVSCTSGSLIRIEGYGGWEHLEETLRLVEQDDTLPPAPEMLACTPAASGTHPV